MDAIKKLEQYLSEEEIYRWRSAEEFIHWVDEKHTIFREWRDNLNSQNLRHEGIAKIWYEEVLPLYCLLKNKADDWKKEKFRLVIGGQNYDVEIQSDNAEIPKYIEITVTNYNETEKARMDFFLQNRRVSLVGDVLIEKNKKNAQKITVVDEFRESKGESIKALIKERINKKIIVVDRPLGTALLIYFDDYIVFRYDNEQSKFEMNIFLDSINLPWYDKYIGLYLAGASGKSFYQRRRSKNI
jgi:hypothetical protein